MDVDDWMPCKIYLSVPLMWEILRFNSTVETQEIARAGLIDPSLTPPDSLCTEEENSTLEITVATSSEISINTTDGGQQSPTLSFKRPVNHSGRASGDNVFTPDTPTLEQVDNLTYNTTPWLYADSSQLVYAGDIGPFPSESTAWWEGGSFNNLRFNIF
jgi:hypothetical protein